MALPTYLELVNDVLVRMREPEVSTVNENVLSKLVGKLVNDAKRQVEDAYKWNALLTDIVIPTVADTAQYTITGSGTRFKISEVHNTTKYVGVEPIPLKTYNLWEGSATVPQKGSPNYYCVIGQSASGDAKVKLWPVPDGVYNIDYQLYIPQEALSTDTATLTVPKEPVVLGAYARALVERGEDGGLNSSEAYALYKTSLADHIAIESSRYLEDMNWEAV
jgi:hypothetical protein